MQIANATDFVEQVQTDERLSIILISFVHCQ